MSFTSYEEKTSPENNRDNFFPPYTISGYKREIKNKEGNPKGNVCRNDYLISLYRHGNNDQFRGQ